MKMVATVEMKVSEEFRGPFSVAVVRMPLGRLDFLEAGKPSKLAALLRKERLKLPLRHQREFRAVARYPNISDAAVARVQEAVDDFDSEDMPREYWDMLLYQQEGKA